MIFKDMGTFADAFRQWPEFPRGLHVLLVDSDARFLRDITHKLNTYQFHVTTFSTGDEAHAAFATCSQTFHVALVEAVEDNVLENCSMSSFLKNVPTIMISGEDNMPLMIRSIALGAVEFLRKPLSDDKLKNIWQHVVRKALDSKKEGLQPGYLEPQRPTSPALTVVDEDHQSCLEHDIESPFCGYLKSKHSNKTDEYPSLRPSVASDKLKAPPTPRQDQGEKTNFLESTLEHTQQSLDLVGLCTDEKVSFTPQTAALTSSTESIDAKEVIDDLHDRAVEFTSSEKERKVVNRQAHIFCCTIPMLESALHSETSDAFQLHQNLLLARASVRDVSSSEGAAHICMKKKPQALEMPFSAKDDESQEAISSTVSHSVLSKDCGRCFHAESVSQSEIIQQYQGHDVERERKEKSVSHPKGRKDTKSSKRRTKLDWTADLHQCFVQAVDYLGDEEAIPSRIMEVMKVEGLTRHNIASHLQKYRLLKKHVQERETEATCWLQSGSCQQRWSHSPGQNTNQSWLQPCARSIFPPLPVWGHPTVDIPSNTQLMPVAMGVPIAWPALLPQRTSMADAWVSGSLSMASHYGTYPGFFPTTGNIYKEGLGDAMWKSHADVAIGSPSDGTRSNSPHCQSKKLLDAAISDVLSCPWKPLPLGLKPPSMESVMAELEQQGITLHPRAK